MSLQPLTPISSVSPRRENRSEHGVVIERMLLESDFDGHADGDRIRFAINDVRRDAKTLLLGQFDDRDDVWQWHRRVERMMVDRVGEHALPVQKGRLCSVRWGIIRPGATSSPDTIVNLPVLLLR